MRKGGSEERERVRMRRVDGQRMPRRGPEMSERRRRKGGRWRKAGRAEARKEEKRKETHSA